MRTALAMRPNKQRQSCAAAAFMAEFNEAPDVPQNKDGNMHLLEVTNPLVPSAESMYPAALAGSVIWGVLSLAMFVWYLWSLSRLFPLLGVKGAWGWIPVWNQWQLLQRAGLPGWLVLLVLVPGVGAFVVLIMTIIAMHRINTEFGKGAGMTVLGACIPPLWATLLTHHISNGRYGAAAGWAPVREGAAAAGAGALQGLPQVHVPPQPDGHPQQNPAGAFVPNYSAQVPPQRSAFAPPLMDAANAAATVAPAAEEVADLSAAPVHPDPAVPAGQPVWGFSQTTVNDYDRLAAQGHPAVPAPPLGVPVQQQTFSWPAPEPATPQTPVPQAYAAPILTAVPDLPVVPDVPVMQAVPVAPAAPAVVEPMTQAAAADDFDDDATVVVHRGTRWGLALPDGETLELLGTDVVVGRRPEPTGSYEVLQISDPTRTLSKSHVRLRRTGEVWTVEDLHSTNGVSLVDDSGTVVELEAGHEQAATEHMLIGTLEVCLVRMS